MPIVHVNVLWGRSREALQRIAAGSTAVLVAEAQVKPDQVRVLIHEVDHDHWFVAGEPRATPAAAPTPAATGSSDVRP